MKNRYGVKVGDIFCDKRCTNAYFFYKVVALRGETQVAVRRIDKKCVAFDGYYKCIVPLPDAEVARVYICKVRGDQDKPYIVVRHSPSPFFGLIVLLWRGKKHSWNYMRKMASLFIFEIIFLKLQNNLTLKQVRASMQ